ncbi:MAG: SPOR domain-containing protein [Bacteroidetes bacterium]|nr:SPOR domain-containing protein [Bacteroidota bacterium]
MEIRKFYFSIFIVLSLILASCSSSQKATENSSNNETQNSEQTNKQAGKDSLYIFDQVPPTQSSKVTNQPEPKQQVELQNTTATFYIVQIGAFTTKDRADEFVAKSKNKVNDELNVVFNPSVNLYVVQLATHYASHDEAEKVRNELWNDKEFKDAWIVTEQK